MKVLVPLDGSERSLAAMEKGITMLAACRPTVTLFVVQHEGFDNAPEDIVEEFAADQGDEIFPTQASAQRMLDTAAQRIAATGVTIRKQVGKGKVVAQIVAACEGHDVVLMHALNRSGFMEKLRLSGTEQLARKVPCSVLLVVD